MDSYKLIVRVDQQSSLSLFLGGEFLLTLLDLKTIRRFPGGAVVKNPPANAGDVGSSPGPGRSHMPCSN